jgi:hypothetical protein
VLKRKEFEEKRPEKNRVSRNMKNGSLKTLLLALAFGVFSGIILAVGLSVFIPEYFTAWAGSLVCPGKIEYVRLKQTYFCYASANDYSDVGDAMFWAIFKRFIFLGVAVCFLFALGFVKLGEFLYKRKDAAGF